MKVPVIKHFVLDEIENGKEAADLEGTLKAGAYQEGTVEKALTAEVADWSLCGSLCTTADVIVRQATFSKLKIGDVLAFANIGAYSVTEGIHLFLSRTMPRILLYKGEGNVEMARDFLETSLLNCYY